MKNYSNVEAQIMAVMSLYKIGDEQGIYAIKRKAKFEENERLQNM